MARPTVFIDAGAFFARYRATDEHHAQAVRGWTLLEQGREVCATTNLVLAEAAGVLIRWGGAAQAAPRIKAWFDSEILQIVRVDAEREMEALALLEKFSDQNLSFIDCTSFVVMKHLRLKRAFAFDKHFTIAGFELWPGRK